MIYITGDTHIPHDIHKLNTVKFPEQKEMTKNDYVIICGDFGGVWDWSPSDAWWLKWLDEKNFTTLFVDGNHENFDLLNNYEVTNFKGGKAHQISDSVYHLMRGQVYQIEGHKIFTMGGAQSTDKDRRVEHESWWNEELPSNEEYDEAIINLEKNNWDVDIIITHCAPSEIHKRLGTEHEKNKLTQFHQMVYESATFNKWFCGHYHTNMQIEKLRVIYNDLLKLED